MVTNKHIAQDENMQIMHYFLFKKRLKIPITLL